MRKKVGKRVAPKKARTKRDPEPDVNQLAQNIVRMSTEQRGPVEVQIPSQSEISRVMAALAGTILLLTLVGRELYDSNREVAPARFELASFSLAGRRSIQLSYGAVGTKMALDPLRGLWRSHVYHHLDFPSSRRLSDRLV